jgi:transposase, IS30 family
VLTVCTCFGGPRLPSSWQCSPTLRSTQTAYGSWVNSNVSPQGRFKFEAQHQRITYGVAPMGIHYTQLDESDRLIIDSMLSLGHSQRAVARLLSVSPSTICREIRRADIADSPHYFCFLGQRVRVARRKRAGRLRRKLGDDLRSACWRHVLAGLRRGWSPQQIAGRLKAMNGAAIDPDPSIPRLQLSHETIYCAIYAQPRGSLRTELVKLLRKSRAGRLPRTRGQGRSTGLQGMTSIELRPPEVAARIVPGHWEGDLIKGARNLSAVGTIVERTSRFVMLVKLDRANASSVLNGFANRLRCIPAGLRKTLTYDQGSEMALHESLAKRLHIDIFFCDPHSPWQRGSNENANGLIREYLPKGADLSTFTCQQLRTIEYSLNTRPRKILGFRTPLEVLSELKLNNIAGVALQA